MIPARLQRKPSPVETVAILLFGGYLAWNSYYLSSWQIPPSILLKTVGLPCPTTGCTRAVLALVNGDVWVSLCYNPMTLPIILLFFGSLGVLAWERVRQKPLLLPQWMARSWFVCLAVGWAYKLASPPMWW